MRSYTVFERSRLNRNKKYEMLISALFRPFVSYLDIISLTNRFGRRFPNCKVGTYFLNHF